MSYRLEKADEGTATLIIEDQNNQKSIQIMASEQSMKALEKYANAKFDSMSKSDQTLVMRGSSSPEKRAQRSADFIASQAREFFESAQLPFMVHEVMNDNSVKRTYGFDQKEGYQLTEVDLPANSKMKSFFRPLGIGPIKASFGFQKALGEELSYGAMHHRLLNQALDKNEVLLHPDNASTEGFNLPRLVAQPDNTQEFLKKQGIKPENSKHNRDADGPGI